MNKYERLKRKIDLECQILDLQIDLKHYELDDNFDEEGNDIRPEDDILAEIEELAELRDNTRRTLQPYCKCGCDTIRKDYDNKIEHFCSDCLRIVKITTYQN